MKKSILACVIASVIFTSEVSLAAFGGSKTSSGGIGVSRSATINRPVSPPPSRVQSNNYNSQPRVVEKHYYNNQPSYNNNTQPSFGSNVASTALGVGAGILGAQAISALIAGPNGTYTHPQHPGVVYNQQGVPQSVNGQQVVQEPQQVIVVKDNNGEFFSFLWGALGNVLHLILFVGVVGALAYGGYKLYKWLKKKYKEEKKMQDEYSCVSWDELEADIDYKAEDLFYDFQKNANNKEWIEQNSKYLNPEDILSPACKVVQYSHEVVDVGAEAGKIRASVKYVATVKEIENKNAVDEKIEQYWHYERNGSKWMLVGVESV